MDSKMVGDLQNKMFLFELTILTIFFFRNQKLSTPSKVTCF